MAQLTATQRVKAATIAAVGYPLIAALGATVRWRVEGYEEYERLVGEGRPPILALWHGRIPAATLFWQRHGIVALTSQNFDGEWVARLMARFGYAAARGSTSHGGARALVQLRRELLAGRPVAFTVDGPRGPCGVVQPGAVWLAGATRHPILPFHLEASRRWTAASWDSTQIPKPFSTVACAIGSAFEVSATDTDSLEAARASLLGILRQLEGRAHAMLDRQASA